MNTSRPRVLFVSHSASRNGATILLLSFLRWLKDSVDWDIEILVHGRGPLLDEFRAIAKSMIWRDPGQKLGTLLPRQLCPVGRALGAAYAWMSLPSGHFDLIYVNTTAAVPMALQLVGKTSALLWHVHELTYAMKISLTQGERLDCFRSATRFIAVSDAVCEALVSDQAIDSARIDVINGFIEPRNVSPHSANAKRQLLRQGLDIPSDAFVVGACGSLGWRKGSDVFLQIARRVMSAAGSADIFFLWVGGKRGEQAEIEFDYDMQRLGLDRLCRQVPNTGDVLEYYHVMDVFALTSREDPFPLVVLEAAEHALPIICFEGAGGANEFVGADSGVRAGYLDVEAFAHEIVQLYRNRISAKVLGERAQLKVREAHRVEVQGPRILQTMQRCLGQARGAMRRDDQAIGREGS